jgi:hypothetical protein
MAETPDRPDRLTIRFMEKFAQKLAECPDFAWEDVLDLMFWAYSEGVAHEPA